MNSADILLDTRFRENNTTQPPVQISVPDYVLEFPQSILAGPVRILSRFPQTAEPNPHPRAFICRIYAIKRSTIDVYAIEIYNKAD
jgi:hypothetical protein